MLLLIDGIFERDFGKVVYKTINVLYVLYGGIWINILSGDNIHIIFISI